MRGDIIHTCLSNYVTITAHNEVVPHNEMNTTIYIGSRGYGFEFLAHHTLNEPWMASALEVTIKFLVALADMPKWLRSCSRALKCGTPRDPTSRVSS